MTFRGNYFEGNLSFNAIIRINAYLSRHRSYRNCRPASSFRIANGKIDSNDRTRNFTGACEEDLEIREIISSRFTRVQAPSIYC